jgi:hypothetical protein
MESIYDYQMRLRESRKAVTESEIKAYHKFWNILLLDGCGQIYYRYHLILSHLKTIGSASLYSLSYGKSEVGNYKVAAGVFKTYRHLKDILK